MLSLNLTPIFNARGITKPYTFLVKAGFTPHSANSIINSKTKVFRLDHIEQLCTVLVCEPNDLLAWTPNNGHQFSENFPLLKLKPAITNDNWHDKLASLPFKQLNEISKAILSNETKQTE